MKNIKDFIDFYCTLRHMAWAVLYSSGYIAAITVTLIYFGKSLKIWVYVFFYCKVPEQGFADNYSR